MATDSATRSEPDVCRLVLEQKSDDQVVMSVPVVRLLIVCDGV